MARDDGIYNVFLMFVRTILYNTVHTIHHTYSADGKGMVSKRKILFNDKWDYVIIGEQKRENSSKGAGLIHVKRYGL